MMVGQEAVWSNRLNDIKVPNYTYRLDPIITIANSYHYNQQKKKKRTNKQTQNK
jgi:hypothetical protein